MQSCCWHLLVFIRMGNQQVMDRGTLSRRGFTIQVQISCFPGGNTEDTPAHNIDLREGSRGCLTTPSNSMHSQGQLAYTVGQLHYALSTQYTHNQAVVLCGEDHKPPSLHIFQCDTEQTGMATDGTGLFIRIADKRPNDPHCHTKKEYNLDMNRTILSYTSTKHITQQEYVGVHVLVRIWTLYYTYACIQPSI